MKLLQARHGWMLVNELDMYVGRSFDLYGEFSQGEVDMFDALVQDEHIVVEVGANIGAHTVPLAKRAAAVLAFEPQRLVFQTLCANVALNGLRNVRTIHAAVGAQPGMTVIPDLDPDVEQNFGCLPATGHEHGEQTMVAPLDAYYLPRVDLIKIDVEGMELEVLKGAAGMIERYRPLLYVEDDREENREALRAHITGLGYRFEEHKPLLFNPDNHAGNAENVFGQVLSSNLICYPAQQ
jgi:FkbM family methyltransferase